MNIIVFSVLFLQLISMLIILVLGIVAIYFFFNSRGLRNAPPVPTSGKVRKAMIEDVAKVLKNEQGQIIMDLGSGWGTLLLPLAKKYPNHYFIGIEYGYIPYWISRFRARKMQNIAFYRQNLFDADISKADIIFMFLMPPAMKKVKIKCQEQGKKGALLYVNRFQMPDTKIAKEVSLGSKYDTYYVYKIKNRR